MRATILRFAGRIAGRIAPRLEAEGYCTTTGSRYCSPAAGGTCHNCGGGWPGGYCRNIQYYICCADSSGSHCSWSICQPTVC